MSEISTQNIIAYASENEEQQLTVAVALAQRMLNLRQELADEQQVFFVDEASGEGMEYNPRQDEINQLDKLFTERPNALPYDVWRRAQIPAYFRDVHKKGWKLLGHCLGEDDDLFFPGRHAPTDVAKEICRGCVIRETCLEYALVNNETIGVWGGMNESERRWIQRGHIFGRYTSEMMRMSQRRQPG